MSTAGLLKLIAASSLVLAGSLLLAQTAPVQITVRINKPGVKISPTFFGLMTEEINHAYDGGLYAELIRNRSFEDRGRAEEIPGWTFGRQGRRKTTMRVESEDAPVGARHLGKFLRVDVGEGAADDPAEIENTGYWGIPIRPKTTLVATFYARASRDGYGPVILSLRLGHSSLAQSTVPEIGSAWRKYTVQLRTGEFPAKPNGRLNISMAQSGTVSFAYVSLFPATYRNRPNGNRIDLMNLLGDMKPSFLRLPGGNYLEGNTIPERFEWKDTIGPVADRPGHQGPWGYRSSDGLGLLEFLEWCEDLRMQPVPAVYAGYSLRQEHVEPGAKLQPYVQDALDEIEYVTGDLYTHWGAERAKDGHPKAFPLTYVEIGNEDAFDQSQSYEGRFAQYYDAIKARWPHLKLIATMPVKSRGPDVVDDHYYRSAAEMARDSGHYDRYPRTGPKIFVGEWASIGGNPTPTFREALGDAAWLTGLERNSDLVVMESYAPLLVNVNPGAAQWRTNLIGYDALTSFGSPSYYVQAMFAQNTGDNGLPLDITSIGSSAPMPAPRGAIGVGTYGTGAEYKDVQVTSNGKTLYRSNFAEGDWGWTTHGGTWSLAAGALRQSGFGPDVRATAGDPNWTDYTYTAKARKIEGREGFLMLFHVRDANDYLQWNIGGWRNTRSAIQRHEEGGLDELGTATNTTVETGRWYDVRIEVRGTDIKCFLDDKPITEATVTPLPKLEPLYAAASSGRHGDIYLKVVNVTGEALSTDLNLVGVRHVRSVDAWVLTGRPSDSNTVNDPMTVAPKAISIMAKSARFQHEFPAYSVTVMRLHTGR